MNIVLDALLALPGTVPNPTPEQPPGTEGIITFMNCVSWIMIIGAVIGFLISAGTLAFAALTGREVNSFKGLALSIVAAVLVGSAGAIMQIFI